MAAKKEQARNILRLCTGCCCPYTYVHTIALLAWTLLACLGLGLAPANTRYTAIINWLGYICKFLLGEGENLGGGRKGKIGKRRPGSSRESNPRSLGCESGALIDIVYLDRAFAFI
ncbi:hypothetical protein ACS0PU_009952 [Formica fusca]